MTRTLVSKQKEAGGSSRLGSRTQAAILPTAGRRRSPRGDDKCSEAGGGGVETSRLAHDFSRVPVRARAPFSIRPKPTISTPGDVYEREADRAAEHVTGSPESQTQPARHGEAGRPRTESIGPSAGKTDSPEPVREVLQQLGRPLDTDSRTFMESRFGHDFSRVRVHTDARAGEAARALHAQAFTVGNDVVFGPGRYSPHDDAGRLLLAHELAHVVQQTGSPESDSRPAAAPHVGRPTLRQATPMISRWADLGYRSWTGDFGETIVIHHWVGTESEWRQVLKDADNEDTYRTYLMGFLELALEPNGVLREASHHNRPNYVNTLKRAPTRNEIMQFLRALYSMAGELDMTPVIFTEAFLVDVMKSQIKKLIASYQGALITEVSEGDPLKQSVSIDKTAVKAVAGEGGRGVSNAMINSAIHTSQEGVAKLIVAHAKKSPADKDKAYSLILNSAKVIRASLDAQEAKLAEAQKMDTLVLKVIFEDLIPLGKIPYVSALTSLLPTLIGHLKATAYQMAVSAMTTDNPSQQADLIGRQFADHLKQLGPGGLKALDVTVTNLAIATFEAGISKK